MLPDMAEQAKAIELGHVQVDNRQNQIGAGNAVTGRFAVFRRDRFIPEIGKQPCQHIANEHIVIYDQHAFPRRSFGPLDIIVFDFHETLPRISLILYRGEC